MIEIRIDYNESSNHAYLDSKILDERSLEKCIQAILIERDKPYAVKCTKCKMPRVGVVMHSMDDVIEWVKKITFYGTVYETKMILDIDSGADIVKFDLKESECSNNTHNIELHWSWKDRPKYHEFFNTEFKADFFFSEIGFNLKELVPDAIVTIIGDYLSITMPSGCCLWIMDNSNFDNDNHIVVFVRYPIKNTEL